MVVSGVTATHKNSDGGRDRKENKFMAKTKKRYSAAEKKAYWIGVGIAAAQGGEADNRKKTSKHAGGGPSRPRKIRS